MKLSFHTVGIVTTMVLLSGVQQHPKQFVQAFQPQQVQPQQYYDDDAQELVIPKLEINSGSPWPFNVTSKDGVNSGPLLVRGSEGHVSVETEDGYSICTVEEDDDDDEEEESQRQLRGGGGAGAARTRTSSNTGTGGSTRRNRQRSFMYCEPCMNENGEQDVCPSTLEVGRDRPNGIPRRVRPSMDRSVYLQHEHDGESGTNYRNRARNRGAGRGGSDGETSTRKKNRQLMTGTLKNLVVLLKFNNHQGRDLPAPAELNILFNNQDIHQQLCPTGSIQQIFKDNSAGQLVLESVVTDWITLPESEAYYANGAHGFDKAIFQAIHYALYDLENNNAVNFNHFDRDDDGKIDAITILHSGYAAEWGGVDADNAIMSDRIWSHKWAMWDSPNYGTWTSKSGVSVYEYNISPALWGREGSDIGRVGVIAHELGHFLGLPDLYDGENGNGLGSYSLMANSWGFDGQQLYPPSLDPWSKIQLGWAQAEVLTHSQTGVSLAPSYTTHQVVKITHGYPTGEYLLIENRRKLGTDLALPTEGLVIYHIDEHAEYNIEGHPGQSNWPSNGNHYKIALLPADGNYDLEKNGNRGDGSDVWFGNHMTLGEGPSQHPNTDSYQGGNIQQTGNIIRNISSNSEAIMTFDYINGVAAPTTAAPTTAAPTPATPATPAPTTTPPVVAYIEPLKVQVHTDNYPSETSWEIVDLCNNNAIVLQGGPYNQADTDQVEEIELQTHSRYQITVRDSYRDGMCCTYGHGFFKVLLKNEVVAEGGDFDADMTTLQFGASSCDGTGGEEDSTTTEEEEKCVVDASWVFIDARGRSKYCDWALKSDRRRKKVGENGAKAEDACCFDG